MSQKRDPESITLEELPGVDPARFGEWKRLHRRARIAPHFGLLAWATAFITVPVVGGGVGWLLPVVFFMIYMIGYVGPLSRAERKLAAELGIPAVLGLPASGISRTRRVIRIVLIIILINFIAGLVMLAVALNSPKEEASTARDGGGVIADTGLLEAALYVAHLKDVQEVFMAARVPPQFFEAASVTPHAGRFFVAAEHESAATPVVVISFGLWQRRFGGELRALGKTIEINGIRATIVGIAPAEFNMPLRTDMWTPMGVSTKDPR